VKNILMIGEYFPLQEVRAEILAKTGAGVMHCRTCELANLFTEEKFDLIVLCSSLGEEARNSALTDVRRRWPFARIVQIFSGCACPSQSSGVDAFVPAAEPASLVQWAAELLGRAWSLPKQNISTHLAYAQQRPRHGASTGSQASQLL
jgi:hypothetical protein